MTALTEDTMILWIENGQREEIRMGDLSRNSRKTVDWSVPHGRWVGGFPY